LLAEKTVVETSDLQKYTYVIYCVLFGRAHYEQNAELTFRAKIIRERD